jgi:chitin synthase
MSEPYIHINYKKRGNIHGVKLPHDYSAQIEMNTFGTLSSNTSGNSGYSGNSNTSTEIAIQTDNYLSIEKKQFQGNSYSIKVDPRLNKNDNLEEFRYLRYTAVDCDPNDFEDNNYTLRGKEPPELFIAITMYNENATLFNKTIQALQKNIDYFSKNSKSSTWGPDSWKKITICIIADGKEHISQDVLNTLGVMGIFPGEDTLDKNVAAHLFEYTTRVYLDENNTILEGHPMNIIFCLKSENKKKINSHRWFFNAFCKKLYPNICVLLDVGTKPEKQALYQLWKAFKRNKNIGGACGEIYVDRNKLWNPLVAAQNFEYKISNILDKPLESICGYISVLPGAFSAYRYEAILGYPLDCYFKGELIHGGSDIFAANMYLAEDRILCFELVTKKDNRYFLKYVRSARAETDVPETLSDLIKQRRRWINGSFFASIYALTHYYHLIHSGHSFIRKIILYFEFFYNIINVIFSWIGLSSFYLTFYFLSSGSVNWPDPFYGQDYLIAIFNSIYIITLIIILIISLGNRPDSSKTSYRITMYIFTFMMAIIIYLSIFIIYQVTYNIITDSRHNLQLVLINLLHNSTFRNIVLSLVITFAIYFISSIIYFEFFQIITCILQYFMLLPTFINVLSMYAFCNINDITWGTRGIIRMSYVPLKKDYSEIEFDVPMRNGSYENFLKSIVIQKTNSALGKVKGNVLEKDDYFKSYRTKILLAWIITNTVIIFLITNYNISRYIYSWFGINQNSLGFNPYLTLLFYCMAVINVIRFIGSIIYRIANIF